jgi:precorrin-6B methylase 2
LNLINSLQPEKGSYLDIGAGTGDFLSVAKKWLAYHRSRAKRKAKNCKNKVFHLLKKTAELENHSLM